MLDKSGLGKTGSILVGASVIIGGKNTFGYTGEIKPFETKFIVVNEESTGLIESPMMEIPINDMDQHFVAQFMDGKDILIKGSLRKEGKNVPVTIAMSGQVHEMSTGFKEGDSAGRTFKIRVDNYIEKVDSKETIKWNRQKIHLEFGGNGVNVLADFANQVL